MPKRQTKKEFSLSEFNNLLRQPHSQATVAELLHRWFHYSISGSLLSTEIRSVTGHLVRFDEIHKAIQIDPRKQAALMDVVHRLRH